MYLKRLIVPALVVLAPCTSLAQQATNVDSLRRAIAQESDTADLRRRELALAGTGKNSTEAMLQRGMLLLRLYELRGENDDASEARDVLERAAKVSPADPRTHYAYGLANSTPLGVRVPSPAGVLDGFVLGQSIAEIIKADPASKAKRSYKKALELDPMLHGAAIELGRLSLASRDKDNIETAALALRQITQNQKGSGEAATMLSELEAALGNLDAAAEAVRVAATAEVGSSAALRAQAAALLRQPGKEAEGTRAYLAGVEDLDDVGAKAYFDDVLPIVTERERLMWHGGRLEDRKHLLKQFWETRAAAGGVTVADRLAEHYTRLALAHERYRRVGKRGSAPGGSLLLDGYASDALPFDDRGIILVRHGEPETIIRTADSDLRPNESWIYQSATGKPEMLNFVALRDGTDYRLVDDILNALDPTTEHIPIEAATKLLQDRQRYEPRYGALAARFTSIRNQSWAAGAFAAHGNEALADLTAATANSQLQFIAEARHRIREDQRRVAFRAVETDSDRPDFTAELPFYYDLFTFRGQNGTTDLLAAVALPARFIKPQSVNGVYVYSIDASVIVIDTLSGAISRRDTSYTFRSALQLTENQLVRLQAELSTPASNTSVHRIVVRDRISNGAGQLYGGTLELPNYRGDGLLISDIVLAERGTGTWQRGDVNLALVPPRQFVERQPIELFYELYNLPANTNYTTEITVSKTEKSVGFSRLKSLITGKSADVQIRFDAVAQPKANGVVQELREVTLQVKPGKYIITVNVTHPGSNQTATSKTEFVVLDQN